VSVKAVEDWLGHASPMVTLQTYAQLMRVVDDRARNVLVRALGAVSDRARVAP
jgi:integrase